MKVYKAKEIEILVKRDSGKVQIHLNGNGDVVLSPNQFATMVRRVIAADRKRATKQTRGKSRHDSPQVVSPEAIKALKARQGAA